MRKVDVVVLGSGISGSVAAMLLAQKGYRVAMISRDGGTKNHLPESWFYHPFNKVHDLGLEDKILPALTKQTSCCFRSADGSISIEIAIADAQKTIRNGDLVQVDRNVFDRVLLNAALEAGVEFFPMSLIKSVQLSSLVETICVFQKGESQQFLSSFIIDATGKSAFLSNHLNLPVSEEKLDARLAYFTHFELLEHKIEKITIISVEGGYLFCVPISHQRISVGCVLAEQAIDKSVVAEEVFAHAVSLSSYVTDLITGAKRVLPIIPAKNHRKICLDPAGLRYRLVGDAAAFLDPFFCPGIDFAFFSAEQAVLTIENEAPLNYRMAIMKWLEESKGAIYQKIEKSSWESIMRLFADPHLPFSIPLMWTQAFTRAVGQQVSLNAGMQAARRSYEISLC